MKRRRVLLLCWIALLALSAAVAAVAAPDAPPDAAPAGMADPTPATSVSADETKTSSSPAAAAPPKTPPSGVQVTVFRASGWPTGTLTIPATVETQPTAPAPEPAKAAVTNDAAAPAAPFPAPPAPAPAKSSSAKASSKKAALGTSGGRRSLLAPPDKKAPGELRVDDPKVDAGAAEGASGARNGFVPRPPGSLDVSAAEVAAVAASASSAASAPATVPADATDAPAAAAATATTAASRQARVDAALVARGNGDESAPLYEVRAGETPSREPRTPADAEVGLDYVRPGDAEGKTVLTSPKKEEAAVVAAVAASTAAPPAPAPVVALVPAPAAAAAPALAGAAPADAITAAAADTTTNSSPFDPLASTPGLQLSIPASEAGTAWTSKSSENTVTASFDASSPGYLVGGGSGDSGVSVCAGRGLALVAAGGAVSVYTAEGVRKSGPTPLSTFFKGIDKPSASSPSSPSSSSSQKKQQHPTGSWSSARCVYDASSSTPESERQFYLAAIYTPAPPAAAEDSKGAETATTSSSSSSSQLIVAATAEGDPTKTWAGPFVVNADGLVGQGNSSSTSFSTSPDSPPPKPEPLPGLARCAPAGCVAKDLSLGIDAHALWASFDLFTTDVSPAADDTSGNAHAASRVGASALGLSRAQLRAGAANRRPTTVALSNFPAWTRALTPATTSPRAKHDSRAGGTEYLVAVSGGAGSGAKASGASTTITSPLVVDDGDASKGTFVAAWAVTGTGTLADGCKDGAPLASTETTYVTKSAAPIAAFFGGAGGGGSSDTKTSKDASSSPTSSSTAVARAPRTLGGTADVSSTRRVGSVSLANGGNGAAGSRKLWVSLSTPVRVGGGGPAATGLGEREEEKKQLPAPVLGASLLAFEIAPNTVEQSALNAGADANATERPKPSLVASTTALLALPSASIVAPAAALARGNGSLVGVAFVTVAADLPPSLAYATFTPESGVSSVRMVSKGASPLSSTSTSSSSATTTKPLSSFAAQSTQAPGDPRAAPSLQRLSAASSPSAAPKMQQQQPLPMPRYSGATTDAEGGWWLAGQITGCESSSSESTTTTTSSVASATTTSPATRGAGVAAFSSCKPVTVYTVARVRAVALD